MISLIILVIAGIFYIKDSIVQKNWYKTDAIIVNYDISNSSNVWTELEYEYNEKDYKTMIKGHSYYMSKGSKVEIYVATKNPENIKIANQLYGIAKTLFNVSIVFIIILLFIVSVYIHKKRRE